MDEQLKNLLNELKGKENTRQNEVNEINMELKRIDLRQETETERFTDGMNEDRNAGLYNNRTDGQMQKIIDEELKKMKDKYDAERVTIQQKLEETQKGHEEEKKADYQKINAAIKDYHLDMVLALNKANRELAETEKQRDEKLAEIDKLIKEKEAERTHLIIKNRNYMDLEGTSALGDINYLGQEIEALKTDKETVNNEYATKLKSQSDTIQYYSQQKERAAKFIGQIRLSEKSIDEIQEILFGNEKEKENAEKENAEQDTTTQGTEKTQEGTQETEKPQEATQGTEKPQEASQGTEKPQAGTPGTGTPQAGTQKAGIPQVGAGNFTSRETTNNTTSSSNQNSKEQNNKFSYEFSMKGIEFDGKNIGINELLKWYKENKKQVEEQIKFIFEGEEEKAEDFLQNSDKLVYLSMAFKSSNAPSYGVRFDDRTKEQLKEYYKIWANPKSQEESKMDIKYDLRGISWLWMSRKLPYREVQGIRDNVYEIRNRKNVTLDKITQGRFAIRGWIEKVKNDWKIKKLDKANSQEKTSDVKNEKDSKMWWELLSDAKAKANEPVVQSNNKPKEQNTQSQEGQEL